MVCENCQELANDVDFWKTIYKEKEEKIIDLKVDFLRVLEEIKKVNNNKCELVEVSINTHITLLKQKLMRG